MEKSHTKKRISVSQIEPGMYVVSLDRSWIETPFLLHRRLIKSREEIELLKKHGIREVVIDTARGEDIVTPVTNTESAPAEAENPSRRAPGISPKSRAISAPESIFRPLVQEIKVAQSVHEEAVAAAQNIFEGVGSGCPVNSPVAKKVVTNLLDSITRSPEANLLLTQVRRFQDDLFTHVVNVCVLSLVVGTLEGFEDELSALGLGALFHDIGQTRLPRNLIRKQSPYTESERRLMNQHPTLGAAILLDSEDIPDLARRIVAEHHERIDGSGYPEGLQGAQISHLSQILSITDTYDNMLTGCNQAPLQPIEVLRQLYLQSNVGAFDRQVIEEVIHCLGVYPVGSLVKLNTGERGVVISTNRADSLRPIIRILSSRDGLTRTNGPIINLADGDSSTGKRRIVCALDPVNEHVDLIDYLKGEAALSA